MKSLILISAFIWIAAVQAKASTQSTSSVGEKSPQECKEMVQDARTSEAGTKKKQVTQSGAENT